MTKINQKEEGRKIRDYKRKKRLGTFIAPSCKEQFPRICYIKKSLLKCHLRNAELSNGKASFLKVFSELKEYTEPPFQNILTFLFFFFSEQSTTSEGTLEYKKSQLASPSAVHLSDYRTRE